jgi:hypothetical protein
MGMGYTMGMGFTMVISPDLLLPPPPAALSCIKTSVNVNDAEQCILLSDVVEVEPSTSAARRCTSFLVNAPVMVTGVAVLLGVW